MGKKKQYIDYLKEIEKLKKEYDLSLDKILLLQISAAFKVDGITYTKLKKEFTTNE